MGKIKGTFIERVTLSDSCRKARGDDGAIFEAVRRLRDGAKRVLDGWPIGKGAILHFAVTIERPPRLPVGEGYQPSEHMPVGNPPTAKDTTDQDETEIGELRAEIKALQDTVRELREAQREPDQEQLPPPPPPNITGKNWMFVGNIESKASKRFRAYYRSIMDMWSHLTPEGQQRAIDKLDEMSQC